MEKEAKAGNKMLVIKLGIAIYLFIFSLIFKV